MRTEFSLVIPCYNEAANLPLLLERCGALVAEPGVEVILVDNGSTDETPGVLRDLLPKVPGCRSVHVPVNRGYGFGVLAGLGAADGDILGWTHADMQTDPEDALHGLALFRRAGHDIFVKGRRCGRPLADTMFTAGMSLFETLLLSRRCGTSTRSRRCSAATSTARGSRRPTIFRSICLPTTTPRLPS